MTNRLPKPNDEPAHKVVIVQTPLGVLQIALPDMPEMVDGDPLKIAMDEFQSAVDSGEPDPLQSTLLKLKNMADNGVMQPLAVGLAVLKQMADNGMLPPMAELVEGTGINPDAVNPGKIISNDTPQPNRNGVIDKLDNIDLN